MPVRPPAIRPLPTPSAQIHPKAAHPNTRNRTSSRQIRLLCSLPASRNPTDRKHTPAPLAPAHRWKSWATLSNLIQNSRASFCACQSPTLRAPSSGNRTIRQPYIFHIPNGADSVLSDPATNNPPAHFPAILYKCFSSPAFHSARKRPTQQPPSRISGQASSNVIQFSRIVPCFRTH